MQGFRQFVEDFKVLQIELKAHDKALTVTTSRVLKHTQTFGLNKTLRASLAVMLVLCISIVFNSCESESGKYFKSLEKSDTFYVISPIMIPVNRGILYEQFTFNDIKNNNGVYTHRQYVRYYSFTNNILNIYPDESIITFDTVWYTLGVKILIEKPYMIHREQVDSLSDEPHFIYETVDTVFVDTNKINERIRIRDSTIQSDFDIQMKLFNQ